MVEKWKKSTSGKSNMEIEGLVVHFGKLQEESCHHRVHGFSRLHGD